MDKEINEPYNTTIISRKITQNEILNIRRTIVRSKGYSGASRNFMR